MSKFSKSFLLVLLSFTFLPLFAEEDSIDSVYDFFQPSGDTKSIWIYVSGELPNGRVSMKYGTKPIMPPEEGIEIEYKALSFHGGEDSRAFNLGGWTTIKRDTWKKVVISFVPRLTGKVRIGINPGYGGKRQFMKYSDLRFIQIAKADASGLKKKLQNPLFDKPLKTSWNVSPLQDKGWEKKLKPVVNAKDSTAPGGKSLRTARDLSQIVDVVKEQEVVFSFYIKADDMFECKMRYEK